MSDEPIIHCTGVHKWFGEFHALRGIDIDVYEGEVIVIFGLFAILNSSGWKPGWCFSSLTFSHTLQ